MVIDLRVISIILIGCLFTTCKKRTTITVKVFNPALNEYVAGAVVSLLELKETRGLLGTKAECNEIATATTDATGTVVFDKEKLHTNSKYKYKVGIKESWGIAHQDPCGSETQNYLDVGKTQEVLLNDQMDTNLKIQFNNLLTPGQIGDSLIYNISTVIYKYSTGSIQGGGGITGGWKYYGDSGYPYNTILLSSSKQCYVGRAIVQIRERKMGTVTNTVDTFKAYPNQPNLIQINW